MEIAELVPLRNFSIVDSEKLIYRSAQPIYGYEFNFLVNELGIKTIVNLRKEKDIDSRFSNLGFTSITIPVIDHHEPTIEQANSFIEIIKQNKDPLLFHCEHGHGRTSTFCVLSRIAMGWSLEQALEEEKDKFNYQFKYQKQIDWLKNNFQ